MTSGRPALAPRTSYQIFAPWAVNTLPGPLGRAGLARAAAARVRLSPMANSGTKRAMARIRPSGWHGVLDPNGRIAFDGRTLARTIHDPRAENAPWRMRRQPSMRRGLDSTPVHP